MSAVSEIIARLKRDRENGAVAISIESCIEMIRVVSEQEEKKSTCGPGYEAECKRLMEQLTELTAEKNKYELMMEKAYQETRDLKSLVARLEGFRDGVTLGINAKNQIETAKELRNCCNRMEDRYE